MQNNFTVIDLFCGAGGFSEGFKSAGFKVIAAIDSDLSAAETFKKSHPTTKFICESIEKIDPKFLRRSLKLKKGQLDCLIGGPPCQAYSINNHQRGLKDRRSGLFRSYLRFVAEFLPKKIVMENVTGILSAGDGRVVAEILKNLKKFGYVADVKILCSEDYGVPQKRRRVIIQGSRVGSLSWPLKTHGDGLEKPVTVIDAIGDLPLLENGEGSHIARYTSKPSSKFQKLVRSSKLLYNHSAPKLSKINLARIKYVPPGGNWRNIPFKLLPLGMKRAKKSDHTKRYGRLRKNGLASTILTKCDIHWGEYIHPSQNRSISIREAARLQSFPDHFEFLGTKSEQYTQIGNAVPPLLARAIADSIMQALSKYCGDEYLCVTTDLVVA
jgi:DNA (cytosine-5)-methyltransferase 1